MQDFIKLDEEKRQLIFMVNGKRMTINLKDGRDVAHLISVKYFDQYGYLNFIKK